MRRLLLIGILPLVLAVRAETPAADHAYAFAVVTLYRGSGAALAEYGSQYAPCTGTTCTVSVALGKREFGRFQKWCGSTRQDVTVTPGSFGGWVDCAAPPPWRLNVSVGLRGANQGGSATHAEPVIVTVEATE